MSQTKQQEQGVATAVPRVRKDWELFWRIIAGLILLVIAWVAWVAYQIMPRSVVTPLAYATQVKPIGSKPAGTSAEAPAATAPPAASVVPAASPSAADAAAPAEAAAADTKEELNRREGLRLATEITLPPAEKQGMGTETKAGGAAADPAAAGAAAKARP